MSPVQLVRCATRTFLFLMLLACVITAGRAFASDPLEDYINTRCNAACVDPDLFRMAIQTASEEVGVDPLILTAIVDIESRFRPRATNRTNGRSIGLAQIQVRWHKASFQGSNYYDVFDNLRVGAGIYQSCLAKHKAVRKALWCYNGHQKAGMKNYVPKVLIVYNHLRDSGVRI